MKITDPAACPVSQPMSRLALNLSARRESLDMTVEDVTRLLNERGVDVAYSTVAGWFNGNRSERWKMDHLKALCDVLQTDLNTMAGDEAHVVEGKVPVSVARELANLSPAQQEAVLALVRSMKGGGA